MTRATRRQTRIYHERGSRVCHGTAHTPTRGDYDPALHDPSHPDYQRAGTPELLAKMSRIFGDFGIEAQR
jgi:hypothetical protein